MEVLRTREVDKGFRERRRRRPIRSRRGEEKALGRDGAPGWQWGAAAITTPRTEWEEVNEAPVADGPGEGEAEEDPRPPPWARSPRPRRAAGRPRRFVDYVLDEEKLP